MTAIFLKVLNMSITASYVILAVLLVRLCLRLLFPEVPKKYSYLLWVVVAFRLICPWSYDSEWSLFRWELFDMKSVQQESGAELEYIPSDITTSKDVQISVGIPAMDEVLQDVEQVIPDEPPHSAVSTESKRQMQLLAGTILWSIGVFILAGHGLLSYWRLQKRMEKAVLLHDNVFQSEQVRSPFIMGFVRPRIYIPFGLKEEDLQYVLAHERTHLQRRDHLVKPLAYLMLAVHWFNPLVWMAFYGMSKDMELSCDEVVLSQGENIRKAYSETLLYLAVYHKHLLYSPLAFGETSVKTRIKNALRWKNPKLATTIGAGIVALLVVFVCAANPEKPTVEEEPFGKYYSSPDDLSGTTLYYREHDRVGLTEIWYVTETGEMLIEHRSGLPDDPVEWLNAGRMEEFSLTTDNFDDYFYRLGNTGYSLWIASDKNPLTQESPGRYRRNNWKAWRVVAKDRMYYVLLQKDGEIYLAYGYYDSEGETDPFSDDSEIFYFKRFAERTPAELQRWGVILVEDYGMENVRPWDPIAERERAALENDGSGHGTEEGDGQSGPESQPEKETSSASSTSKYKTLTLDIVRALAAKHDTLTVEDLAPYLDVRAVTERGSSLKKELVFEDGSMWYVAAIRKENCDVGYRIFLKEAYFTEEEFLEMTESVVMAPHAFY